MKLSLRYCKKCKRKTIQVCMKILTTSAMHSALNYIVWARDGGREVNLADEEEKRKTLIHYCPQCGRTWRDYTETIRKDETKEVVVGEFDRIEVEWDLKN